MRVLSNIVGTELLGSGTGFQSKFPTMVSKANLINSSSSQEINSIIDKAISKGVFESGVRSLDNSGKKTIIQAQLNQEQKGEPSFMPNYGETDKEGEENPPTGQSQFKGGEGDFDIQKFLDDGEGEGEGEGESEGEGEGEGKGEGQGQGEDDGEGEGEGEPQLPEFKEDETEEEREEREQKEKEEEEKRENLNLLPLIIIPDELKKNKDVKYSLKESEIGVIISIKANNEYYGVQKEFMFEVNRQPIKLPITVQEGRTLNFDGQVNLLNKKYEDFAKSYNEEVLTKYKSK